MNKLKKILLNIWYSLPFGLKAAGDEIMGSGEAGETGTEIQQQVSDQRVAKHLLKGEVTQEVEELRYRTYRVAGEAENYDYLGNGVAVKSDKKDIPMERSKYKFSQENKMICNSVLEEISHIDDYGDERYTFEMTYDGLVRFKLEQFTTSADIFIDTKEKIVKTTLHFEKQPNPYNAKSMPFINELKKLYEANKTEYFLKNNEIASSLQTFSLSTYKANGERDFVTYSFVEGAKFDKMEETSAEYMITYDWDGFIRLPLNLESKYYSKSMADKYERKERKDVAPEMVNSERKRYCSICGKEMSTYDADILEASGQPVICKECMEKVLKNAGK
jgi:hypothetical protein